MSELNHLNKDGMATMVDVSDKNNTKRLAKAQARVVLPEVVWQKLHEGEVQMPKGPVFQVAILAGIMAAKRTGELIPLCHPLGLDAVDVNIHVEGMEAVINASASCEGKTGVEMEALTAASVSALTVYDMCKALSHDIVIREIRLMEKSGGKHDFKRQA